MIAPVTNKNITYNNPPKPTDNKVDNFGPTIGEVNLKLKYTTTDIIAVEKTGFRAVLNKLTLILALLLTSIKFKIATTKYAIVVLIAAPLTFNDGILISIYENIVFTINPTNKFFTG